MKKSFRPTKVASKRRRDLLNIEISQIRNVLPFSELQRQRLSQLQVMSLSCAYVSLNNFVTQFKRDDCPNEILQHFSLTQMLPGFVLILAGDGRVLYASDNVSEYLGYSAVELLTQGETVYDFIDKCDQSELRSILESMTSSDGLNPDLQMVICRMFLAQNCRSLIGHSRHKTMEMKGRVLLKPPTSAPCESMSEAIFVAFVVPHSKPQSDVWAITSFETVHSLDLRITKLDHNGCVLLGYESGEIESKSWYELIHPDDIPQAKAKHFEVLQFRERDDTSSVCVRIQTRYGYFVWLQIVMILRHESNNEREIVCNNCILKEADAVKRLNCKETNREIGSIAYSGNLRVIPTPEQFDGGGEMCHGSVNNLYRTARTSCATGGEMTAVQTSLKSSCPLLRQILNRPAIQAVNVSKREVSLVESLLTPQNSPLESGRQHFPLGEDSLLRTGIPIPSDFDPPEATSGSLECMDWCMVRKQYSTVVPSEFGNAEQLVSSVHLEPQTSCYADDGSASVKAIVDALTEIQNDPQFSQEMESTDLSVFCESFPELEAAENPSVSKHQNGFQAASLLNALMPYMDLSLTKLSHTQIELLSKRLSELNKLHETMIFKAVIDTLHDDTRREHVISPVASMEFQNLALSAECKAGFGSQSGMLLYENCQSYPLHKSTAITQMPGRTLWN